VKYRRQHPFGNYIADFACLAPRLIVELNGSQHADQVGYDAQRDRFFRTRGFEVLRFGSNEPFLNLEGVLWTIFDAVQRLSAAGPHPNLPPEGEGVSI
jgi:BirA family biotin operon repressor/biotin-[acetyl-CoA-carboxylase] ligase